MIDVEPTTRLARRFFDSTGGVLAHAALLAGLGVPCAIAQVSVLGETHIEHFCCGRRAAAFRLEEPQIVSDRKSVV